MKLENQLRHSVGNLRPMYLLLGGNDTVPISMWCGRGICSTECRLVTNELAMDNWDRGTALEAPSRPHRQGQGTWV